MKYFRDTESVVLGLLFGRHLVTITTTVMSQLPPSQEVLMRHKRDGTGRQADYTLVPRQHRQQGNKADGCGFLSTTVSVVPQTAPAPLRSPSAWW
jgi:hypothetical protein